MKGHSGGGRVEEDWPRPGPDEVIDLTDAVCPVCPEGHRLEQRAPFCPVCLAPVTAKRAFWSVNRGASPL